MYRYAEPCSETCPLLYPPIGFKEFREFLASPDGPQEVFNKAVEHMEQSTRQYAKRHAWLRNKLLPAMQSANVHSGSKISMASMYILDATGRLLLGTLSIVDHDFFFFGVVLGEQWTSNVLSPAESITNCRLSEH